MLVLAIIIGILLLLLSLRVGAVVQYDAKGFVAWAKVGFVRVKVYPRPEKAPKEKKEKKPKPPKEPEEAPVEGGTVDKLKAGLSIVGPILEQVKRRLVFSEIRFHYTVSTKDAAATALAYGGAQVAVQNLLGLIGHNFKVKKQDVRIGYSFDGTSDTVFLRLGLRISVWGALRLGLFSWREVRKSGLLSKGATKHGQASHQ